MDRLIRQIQVILLILIITGCSSHTENQFLAESEISTNTLVSPSANELKHNLLSFYHDWEGVPYQLGGSNRYGIDCSAFVQRVYLSVLNIRLPRTTSLQVKLGYNVNYQNAQIGDLTFFKTSPSVRHVGIYIGKKQFVHASTSKGVIISRLDNPYWASKFWHFRRVTSPSNLD
ncbi:C40 family peptidase [Vibrio hepatarius]|uniref:C40 family peptidase n=1 Tax=Vibrio hepatarius TaxID=171383 RepID=UPI001C089511|nr:NlpC/P60 family protein [Vibrio hepatarius]MBU2898976.1 C40 family peptidase [Vibrio hepatarius]